MERARYVQNTRQQETMQNEATEDPADQDWITAVNAGRILGVHRNTVILRAAQGAYRMKSVGSVVFVSKTDVEEAAKAA